MSKSYGFYCSNCGNIGLHIEIPTCRCPECHSVVLSCDVTGLSEKEATSKLQDNRYYVACYGGCGYIINCTPPLSDFGHPYRAECYVMCCNCCRTINGKCPITVEEVLAA